MRGLRAFALLALTAGTATLARAEMDVVCDALEGYLSDPVFASIRYESREARNAAWSAADTAMHLEFISRVIARAPADRLWPLCEREDVSDIELIGEGEKDSVLHRLLELWRIHHYVVGGRFEISAFNFSQGVRASAIGKDRSAERTMAEALEAIARKLAPVFVAAGNEAAVGVSKYAVGASVFPVVATENAGAAIYGKSSRPDGSVDPRRLFLFADGAPRPPAPIDEEAAACEQTGHLTVGQMLLPEEAGIDPGGSSFATFAATAAVCPIHQYLEVMNAYLSATQTVGATRLHPFIAYYVDNPISPDCPTLDLRLADKQRKFAPIYYLQAPEKQRIQNFFFGNSVVFNLRYSTPLLRAFFRSLPETTLAEEFRGPQHYVSQRTVLQHLSGMTFSDWLALGGNRRSLYYSRWREKAAEDTAPVLSPDILRTIAQYCEAASLFVVLSDDPPSPF